MKMYSEILLGWLILSIAWVPRAAS